MRTLLALLLAPMVASAHFVFVVPQKDGTLRVVFSETLEVDVAVTVEKIKDLNLKILTADGKSVDVKLTAKEHEMNGKLGDAKPQVAYGAIDYGVMKRGESTFLLRYVSKTLWSVDAVALGEKTSVEIIPTAKDGKTILRVMAGKKPVVNAEINIINGDGQRSKVKTDAEGRTEAMALTGQYGAWVRYAESKAGKTAAGESYKEIRHYATLVAPAK